jgi:hypothetical protein
LAKNLQKPKKKKKERNGTITIGFCKKIAKT